MSDPNRPDFPGLTMTEIRTALGHKTAAPAAEQPIEVGQVYRPAPYNQARLPEDRITVTTVYDADSGDERTIAYEIASVDHRNRPITTGSAMRESVFRKCYALDAPEADPESPEGILVRALGLLGSLDSVAYVVVRPGVNDTLDVETGGNGMDARDAATAFGITAKRLFSRADGADAREKEQAAAKARTLRETANAIESRNDGCNVAGVCSQCGTRTVEADRLRRQAADIEAATNADRCTCGVPTDPTAVHRTDAPCYVKDTDQ